MSQGIRLLDASVADAAALAAAGERLFVQAYGKYSRPDDLKLHVEQYFGRENVSTELQKPGCSYTIACDDDGIAGFIKIWRGPAPDSIPANTAVEVQQLYVDGDRQRQGVGRKLMDRALATARQEGYAGLWLSVWQDADWAVGFYEAYGFRRVGTAEFRLGQSRFKDYLMWLALHGSG
ncbi:MAG TPA: N-acetyltransferase [Woeseiaceae bacterium]|nr:N-acetyltransferase [Woeseiaceae bacterium]